MAKVSDTGYILESEETIVEDVRTIVSDSFVGLNVDNESPMGQVVLSISSQFDEWQKDSQNVFNSFDLDSATGQDLDNIGKLVGLERKYLSPSVMTVQLTSSATGYTITEGSSFYATNDSSITFTNQSDISVTTSPQTAQMISDEYIESGTVQIGDKLTSVSSYPSLTDIEVTSIVDGVEEETDNSYRERLKRVRVGTGASGIERMDRALQELTEVQDSIVFDINNDPGVTLGYVEPVVLGGADNLVAQTIWDNLDMGTATAGTSSEVIQDYKGNNVTINFSRPTLTEVTFALNVSLITGLTQAQREAIVQAFEDLLAVSFIGGTLYYQDFYSAVVQIISGTAKISSLTIDGGTSDIVAGSREKLIPDATIDPNVNITIV